MKVICLLFALLVVTFAQPTPPTVWPGTWYTWVVTSVVKVGVDKPLLVTGQLISYDTIGQTACRYLQQNLITPVANRPIDVCDFGSGLHYMMDDTTINSTCKGTSPLQGKLAQIVYPPEYLTVARFLGVDKVAQKDCNHFVAMSIVIDGENVQMDVWTAVDTSYPCQISVTDLVTRVVTTWAFDGFAGFAPPAAAAQCSAAKIMCAEENWVCNPKPNTDPGKLGAALTWVCDPTHLDCSPINPGGPHYIPNTLLDHCNWAFNAYYRLHRTSQGVGACDFGGIGNIIPPANASVLASPNQMTFNQVFGQVFSNNIVCDRAA